MESAAALSVVFTAPDPAAVATSGGSRRAASAPERQRSGGTPTGPPVVDQPAVVVVELPGADGSSVVRALLDSPEPLPTTPVGSYLVLTSGPAAPPLAFVPGYRPPTAGATGDPVADLDELAAVTESDSRTVPDAEPAPPPRPPRRVEVSLPAPLLAESTLVVAPPTGAFGPAYARIVLEAAERGGAMLLVAAAPTPLGEPELDLAVQAVERGIAVFLALTQAPEGDERAEVLRVARAEAEQHAMALAELVWYAIDAGPEIDEPVSAVGVGVTELREGIQRWAADEMRRRSQRASMAPRSGPIRVSADGPESGWEQMLSQEIKWRCHAVWQRVAIELAHIHLRGVHELIFGAGCAGLPYALDRDLHSLSIFATRQLDTAVGALVERLLPAVLARAPDEAALRLIGATLRRTLDDDLPEGRTRDRILLVTSTSGLAVVSGTGAEVNLPSYLTTPTGPLVGVVPPIGVALTGGCYLYWRDPAHADVDKCRYWLQRVVREVESELRRELELRFQELRKGVVALVQDAFEHGIVLI